MDPTNRKAVAGLIAMGQSLNTNSEAPYASQNATDDTNEYVDGSFEMGDIVTAATGEAESESEAVWSDVEIEVNTT